MVDSWGNLIRNYLALKLINAAKCLVCHRAINKLENVLAMGAIESAAVEWNDDKAAAAYRSGKVWTCIVEKAGGVHLT